MSLSPQMRLNHVRAETGDLEENIADHTIKTLQETENKLINYKNQRTSFSVDL